MWLLRHQAILQRVIGKYSVKSTTQALTTKLKQKEKTLKLKLTQKLTQKKQTLTQKRTQKLTQKMKKTQKTQKTQKKRPKRVMVTMIVTTRVTKMEVVRNGGQTSDARLPSIDAWKWGSRPALNCRHHLVSARPGGKPCPRWSPVNSLLNVSRF